MTFRVSLNIDGNAAGAKRALDQTGAAARTMGTQFKGLDRASTELKSSVSAVALASVNASRAFEQTNGAVQGLDRAVDNATAGFEKLRRAADRIPAQMKAAAQETSRFQDGLKNTATAITLIDGPLGGFASRVTAISSIFGSLPLPFAAATLAITGITAALTVGLSEFASYQKEVLTTEAIIRTTGGSAGKTAKDIELLAHAIGQNTLVDEGDLRGAANQLLSFRTIAGDTFDRTLELAADLSSNGFGSIEQATIQLAKALEDPISGLNNLRRVGVSFTGAQKDLVFELYNTGRALEAQEVILDQVAKKMEGAAAAGASGLAGATDDVVDGLMLLMREAGQSFDENTGLTGFLGKAAKGLDRLNKLIDPSLRGLVELKKQFETNAADIARLEQQQANNVERTQAGIADPSKANPDNLREAVELRSVLASIRAEQARIGPIIEQMTKEQTQAAADSAKAQAEIADEKAGAVIRALDEEAEAIRRTKLEAAQLTAVQEAGVAPTSELAAIIREKVQANFEDAEAIAEATAAEKEAEAAKKAAQQTIDDLIRSLETEIAVMQAADPVMAQMIANRGALANATDAERGAVEALIAAKEREIAVDKLGGMQTTAEGKLRAAELELKFEKDPVGLARAKAQDEIAAAQKPLRDGATLDELRALDDEAGNYVETLGKAAALEEQRRANAKAAAEAARGAKGSKSGGGGSAGSAIGDEGTEAQQLLQRLQLENAILNEIDPVQKEIIRNREALATATAGERVAIEELIRKNQELEEVENRTKDRTEQLADAYDGFSEVAAEGFGDLILRGESLNDTLANMASRLADLALQAALFGEGPFADLFGSSGGGLFGILKAGITGAVSGGVGGTPITPDPFLYASGGAVFGPGSGTSDSIPARLSNGEFVVNAAATSRHRGLLERINAAGFADGGFAGRGMQSIASGGDGRPIKLEISLSDDLDARIDDRSTRVAAKVTKEGLSKFSRKALPDQARSAVRDRRAVG